MIFNIADATGLAMLDALNLKLNAGATGGTIKLYAGTIPTDANTAIGTQVLLGTLTLSKPAGVVALVAGVPSLTFSAITSDASADATGTCTWARTADSDGNTVGDFDVSNTGGNGFGQMNNVSISIDGPLSAPSAVITL